MKFTKLFIYLLITYLLFSPNLHSQTEQQNKVLMKTPKDLFLRKEIGVEKRVLEEDNFKDYLYQIIKTATVDSTTKVIDSVVVTKADHSKEKHNYTYDSNRNKSLHYSANWDGWNWVNDFRYTYIYDTDGNMTSEMYEKWNDWNWVNDWEKVWLLTYTYDPNGDMVSEFAKLWDGGKWVNIFRGTYTYDSNVNMTMYFSENWDSTKWVNDVRYTYTYDFNRNMTSRLHENWDSTKWVNDLRYTYTFDSNGNRTSYFSEDWNSTNWVNYSRRTYTYDPNGNRTSYFYENWDGTNWVNSVQGTYTYDSNGNRALDLYESWDDTNWVNYLRYTYSHDSNGNITSRLHQTWNGTNWILVNKYYSFESSLGNLYWFSGAKIKIFYKTITGIDKKENGILEYTLSQNYPNPFNPSTTIKYEIPDQVRNDNVSVQLSVYDLLGREVAILVDEKQRAGTYEVKFNASSLNSGIYFYQIKAGNFVESRKMILIK